jgi:hypothetical protein
MARSSASHKTKVKGAGNYRIRHGITNTQNMKKEEYVCDIKGCPNEAIHKQQQIQTIFTTDQTEGRSTAPYLSIEKLDLCEGCLNNLLAGNMIHGAGAQGYNEYWFTNTPEA